MSEVLNCHSCGGVNKLPDFKFSMFCAYCGQVIEKRGANNAFPEPTTNPQIAHFLELARTAEESKNYEEAVTYFNKALEYNPKLSEAWFGKASCSGASSTLKNNNISQVVANFKKAIDFSDDANLEGLKERVLVAINNFAIDLYTNSFNHTAKFATVDGAYQEHLNRVLEIIEALEKTLKIDPNNATIKRTLVDIAKGVKKPIYYNDYKKNLRFHSMSRSAKRQMQDIIEKYSNNPSGKRVVRSSSQKEIKDGIIIYYTFMGMSMVPIVMGFFLLKEIINGNFNDFGFIIIPLLGIWGVKYFNSKVKELKREIQESKRKS